MDLEEAYRGGIITIKLSEDIVIVITMRIKVTHYTTSVIRYYSNILKFLCPCKPKVSQIVNRSADKTLYSYYINVPSNIYYLTMHCANLIVFFSRNYASTISEN